MTRVDPFLLFLLSGTAIPGRFHYCRILFAMVWLLCLIGMGSLQNDLYDNYYWEHFSKAYTVFRINYHFLRHHRLPLHTLPYSLPHSS